MLYHKPRELSYSQLFIWIDENGQTETCNEYTLYTYLYVVIDMLAKKGKYFRKASYYEDFALFATNIVFLRLRQPKRTKKHITYILPYLNKALPFYKVQFQNKEFKQRDDNVESIESIISFSDILGSQCNELRIADFKLCLGSIDKTMNAFFNTLPKKRNSSEWYNIKLSVSLSFLSELCGYNNIILISLPDNYKSLIAVLVNELKAIIAKDLSEDTVTFGTSGFTDIEMIMNRVGRKRLGYFDETEE